MRGGQMCILPRENAWDFKSSSLVNEENRRHDAKRKMPMETNEDRGDGDDFPEVRKKERMIWTPSLHHVFLVAVEQLGHTDATPRKILELMKGYGLSRENIASHLQKFRMQLRKYDERILFGDGRRNPSNFISMGYMSDLAPPSHPPFSYNRPNEAPQLYEQQNYPFAGFRQAIGGNIQSFNLPNNMSPLSIPQFNSQEDSNFMSQERNGNYVMASSQDMMQQRSLGNASGFSQEIHGGQDLNCGLSESTYIDYLTGANKRRHVMVNQQQQVVDTIFNPSASFGPNSNSMNVAGGNCHSSPGDIGIGNAGSFENQNQAPYFHHANNCSAPQMTNPVVMNGMIQTGSFGEELLNMEKMDEHCKSKRPIEAVLFPDSSLRFGDLSTNSASEGKSSSRAFVEPYPFATMPALNQHQEHREEDNVDDVLDFLKTGSIDELFDFWCDKGNQPAKQQQDDEGVEDPEFDFPTKQQQDGKGVEGLEFDIPVKQQQDVEGVKDSEFDILLEQQQDGKGVEDPEFAVPAKRQQDGEGVKDPEFDIPREM